MSASTDLLATVPAYARSYWDGLAEGRIVVPRCTSCGRLRFPPMPRCIDCGGTTHEPVEMSGRGTVASVITTHRRFGDVGDLGEPYTTLLVELEEGPRVYGILDGGGSPRHGDAVRLGGVIESGKVFCAQFRIDADASGS